MAKKKKRSQAMSDSSDEEKKSMGTLRHMALLSGERPIKVATPRVLVPRGMCPPATSHRSPVTGQSTTGQPATGHSPNGQEDISERPVTGHRSPVTSHQSNGHYTRIFKSINHRSPTIQAPIIGLRKYHHKGSQYSPATGQPVTDHRSSEFYINLHLEKLMPWAWSSLIIIIITQKSFITPGTGL